jgi:gustatory receptor
LKINFLNIYRKERSEILGRNVLIFNYLCRASQELNDIFSVPVFILLTAKFISVVSVAFAYIYNKFIRTDVMLDNHSVAFLFWFVAAWIQILILLAAADMPANQVRHLRERVTAISSSGLSQSLTGKLTVHTFLIFFKIRSLFQHGLKIE